jgi:hypothetical protein
MKRPSQTQYLYLAVLVWVFIFCLLADGATCCANSEGSNFSLEPQQHEYVVFFFLRAASAKRIGGGKEGERVIGVMEYWSEE